MLPGKMTQVMRACLQLTGAAGLRLEGTSLPPPSCFTHPFPPPADATEQTSQSPEKVCLNEEEEEEEAETLDGQGGQVSPNPRGLPGKVVHLITDI